MTKKPLRRDILKDCPFCGSNIIRVETANILGYSGTYNRYWVRCVGCDVTTVHDEVRPKVIAKWNRRTKSRTKRKETL